MLFKDKPSMTKKPDRPVKERVTQKPLLTIELQDETSVPKVFYEGEEITHKARVSFDWETEKAMPNSGGTKFNIDYVDVMNGGPIQKGIGLARGKYLCNE